MERKHQTGQKSRLKDGHVHGRAGHPEQWGGTLKALGTTLPHIGVTPTQKPHYGLYNQGATCYLNSVLQVLYMTTEIHDRLEPKMLFQDQELLNIFRDLKKTRCETTGLTFSLKIDNVNQQFDAAECLEMILHKISPQASEVFQGQLTYTIKCLEGHIINEESNPFWTLPLSLKDAHDSTFSVEGGFERVFQTKTFSGDNLVYCNECKRKTEAISGCEMTKFPQNLILLLKRFDFDYSTMSHVKSDCSVEFPRKLKTEKKTYKLYGMVNHTGGLSGGHYTATVLSKKDRTWYEFDDDQVRKAGLFSKKMYNSSVAYLLVYRGKNKGGHSVGKKFKQKRKGMKPKKKEQKDPKSQMPKGTRPEDVTGEAEEEEGGDSDPEEQREDEEEEQKEDEEEEQKEDEEEQKDSERNTDDEKNTQPGLHEEDELEEMKFQVAENRKPVVSPSDDPPDEETTTL